MCLTNFVPKIWEYSEDFRVSNSGFFGFVQGCRPLLGTQRHRQFRNTEGDNKFPNRLAGGKSKDGSI